MPKLKVVTQNGEKVRNPGREAWVRFADAQRGPMTLLAGLACWTAWVAMSPERTAIVGWTAVVLLAFWWLRAKSRGHVVHHYHHNVED